VGSLVTLLVEWLQVERTGGTYKVSGIVDGCCVAECKLVKVCTAATSGCDCVAGWPGLLRGASRPALSVLNRRFDDTHPFDVERSCCVTSNRSARLLNRC
jgi:hypothetical protein